MSITANTSVLASEYIPQEIRQQNNEYSVDNEKRAGTLTDGKTVSDAARGTHVGGNAAAERDVVTISEEARNMQKNMSQDQEGENAANAQNNGNAQNAAAAGGSEDSAGGSAIDQIYKQIKQVKEQLQDAQQRLSEATARASAEAKNSEPKPEPKVQSSAEEDGAPVLPGGSQVEALTGGMAMSSEVETIQEEISQLNQQLQTLYQELQKMQKEMG